VGSVVVIVAAVVKLTLRLYSGLYSLTFYFCKTNGALVASEPRVAR